jgi:hypothetical protein
MLRNLRARMRTCPASMDDEPRGQHRPTRTMTLRPDPASIVAETRAWVDRVVIDLNLCPFAKAVQVRDLVRYVVSEATDEAGLVGALLDELTGLAQTDPQVIETTLLIHPNVLADFDAFNRFLDVAEAAVAAAGLEGVFQLASFHPRYRFAGSAPDDVTNATNRSPYPMLHLLREASVDRAVTAFPDAASIYEKNMRTLRGLGKAKLRELLNQCRADGRAAPSAAHATRAAGGRRRI